MRSISIIIALLLAAGLSFGAEVSKKQDISITPVFTDVPKDELQPGVDIAYFDAQLSQVFLDMKRFNVIGYGFKFDNFESIDAFIQKVREAKEKQALKDEKYRDADLGVIIIPAEEMAKLAGSFFITIPSMTSIRFDRYKVTNRASDKEIKSRKDIFYITEVNLKGEKVRVAVYEKEIKRVRANIIIRFIDADGQLLEQFRREATGTGDDYPTAYKSVVNNSLSGLSGFLRAMPQFKLKSVVLATGGGNIRAELGADIGVRPGYEWIVKREAQADLGFSSANDTGLVRVNLVNPTNFLGTVIFGAPQVGDQLIEAPMSGARFVPFLDIYAFLLSSAGGDLVIMPTFGISFEGEIGYNGLGELRMGYGIPLGLNLATGSFAIPLFAEIGGGTESYLGMFSFQLGATVGFGGIFRVYADTDLDSDILQADVYIKPKAALNIQFSQGFKIRLGAGLYAGYDIINNSLLDFPLTLGACVNADLIFRL